MQLAASDLLSRIVHDQNSNEHLNETCEKFYQIWSHKAANISNDLIEYTIRRLQSDRLRHLFQIRNDFTHKEQASPICQMPIRVEDDLERIKEYIRRFCLTTRHLYRHLRSDSRIYPKMCIDLDQGIMIKICRFIFKTKVLIKIFSSEKHINPQQRDELKKQNIEYHDPYKNIIKAFIVLQSNFEILFGDIFERDLLQNAKSAVQTLPIVLDTSKTIRLIFCALYQLSEPERHAEAEAIRQRRSTYCDRRCPTKKPKSSKMYNTNRNKEMENFQFTETLTESPGKTVSTKKKDTPKRIISPKSQLKTPKSKQKQKSSENLLSTPSLNKRDSSSTKKSSTLAQKKSKKNKNQNQNQNPSSFDSTQDDINCGWTTWLQNATMNLAVVLPKNNIEPEKSALTTWAAIDRVLR